MPVSPVARRFGAALDALVAELRKDESVLAAILCGSLSHDTVWERSDIDLVLVTVDDRHVESGGLALFADGINVHAVLMPRSKFRSVVEGSVQNSFIHALLAKGRLLYTHDETIERLCDRLREVGERDARLQLLCAAIGALPCIDKAHKWFVTRADLHYTALWILFAAEALARIEVIEHGLVADREVLPQALTLNPGFFSTVYTALLERPKTTKAVKDALDAVDRYVDERTSTVFEPLFTYLRETAEARSATEIENHFSRNLGVGGVTTACEYLAAKGLIGKASLPVRLTKRSHVDVQELAFYHLASGEPEDDLPPGARPRPRSGRRR
jgi:predicted nucleotidyltransferase